MVGAGLDPVRPPRALAASDVIHVLGAAGAGASAAALLGIASGAAVSGCDPGGPSPYTRALEAAGLRIIPEHDPRHVTDATSRPTRLSVTKALTAIAPDHPELAAARAAGIPVEPWQQVVADAAVGRTLVGVAGTHGKSTTAGWLVHALAAAGRDPSAFVGALLPSAVTGDEPATARIGAGGVFIVEADEYAGNFDAYRPAIAILTSVEWDHPDVFRDRAAVVEAFVAWLEAIGEGWPNQVAPERRGRPVLVANVGDAGVVDVLAGLSGGLDVRPYALIDESEAPPALVSVGAADPARGILTGRITAEETRATRIEIAGLADGGGPLLVRLPTAGRHNVSNALAVAAGAVALGLDRAEIVAGLETFPGVGRRLEWKGEARGVTVYDDYGHHPTAIRETIRAIRQREPDRRLWAVYEPLTYHRTAALHDAFADALGSADAVAIARIWAGRDPDTSIDSAEALAGSIREQHPGLTAEAPGDVEETARWLADRVVSGDAVLVMGGGHSYRIGERLLERLEGD